MIINRSRDGQLNEKSSREVVKGGNDIEIKHIDPMLNQRQIPNKDAIKKDKYDFV